MKLRSAFTMTELIFVIVVIGILASIALPRIGNSI
ncbi:MAG: type II secretion system protein, partial [Sulfuricurvum sp.]|nr:type II secretion system protein [Sulfuricurvum sp.]